MKNGLIIGIIAIIAGVLILWGRVNLNLIVGIFLIVYGILVLIGRK